MLVEVFFEGLSEALLSVGAELLATFEVSALT
jgi:hypothetical protein